MGPGRVGVRRARRWSVGLSAALLLGMLVLFVVGPFLMLLTLASAYQAGDAATLARHIDFVPVRASVKRSLAEHPTSGGIWQRVGVAAFPGLTAQLVDRYLSPEGLPNLLKRRQQVKTLKSTAGVRDPKGLQALKGTELEETSVDRGLALLGRVENVRWKRLDRMAFEVRDRMRPQRAFKLTMAFAGTGWKLVGVEIVSRAEPTLAQGAGNSAVERPVVR
jgi:hypothetical protein